MSRTRVLVALLATMLLAVPVSTASAAKKVKVRGGATTLALDAGTAQALTDLGLTVAPIKPSKAGDNGIRFAIPSGRLDSKSYAGRINHTGGLRISSASTAVDLEDFRIVIDKAPNLTAVVGGARVSIADLDLSDAKVRLKGRTLRVTNVAVTLSDAAATALNDAFGTDALKGGLPLGTASVKTKVRS